LVAFHRSHSRWGWLPGSKLWPRRELKLKYILWFKICLKPFLQQNSAREELQVMFASIFNMELNFFSCPNFNRHGKDWSGCVARTHPRCHGGSASCLPTSIYNRRVLPSHSGLAAERQSLIFTWRQTKGKRRIQTGLFIDGAIPVATMLGIKIFRCYLQTPVPLKDSHIWKNQWYNQPSLGLPNIANGS
jgi:hypothetical protein